MLQHRFSVFLLLGVLMLKFKLIVISVLVATALVAHAHLRARVVQCQAGSVRCVQSTSGANTMSLATTRVMLPLIMHADGRTNGTAPFYAYYYLWWSSNHWKEKLGPNYPWDSSWPLPGELDPQSGCGATPNFAGSVLMDVPRGGAYDQSITATQAELNATIYATHIRDAAASGLTGFLIAWKGIELDSSGGPDRYSKRLDVLIRTIRSHNQVTDSMFNYGIAYETHNEVRSTAQIISDLEYLLANYGGDNTWGRMQGRHIVYWHNTKIFPTATLQAIYERFSDRLLILGWEDATTWTAQRAQYLDGSSRYWSTQDPYSNPHSFQQNRELAARIHADGRLWFAPLAPGYNDELAERAQGRSTGLRDCVPRKGSETMRRLYEGNQTSNPDGWIVISWNEWVEHTYIEPSKRYGSMYLNELSKIITNAK
jgi:hypothetical protein